MIYQTTKDLHFDLKSWGCYFLCLIRIFEKLARVELRVDQINQIYKLCRQLGYVGPEAYIVKGGIRGVSQIASAVAVENVYMRLSDNQGMYNYLLAKYSRKLSSGKYNSHFVLMEGAEKPEYDPYPNSKTVREGSIKDYRYIFGEEL
jgi:predicted membrane-bound dolichyl-phosphate-mannose-protein mannosyltransferase